MRKASFMVAVAVWLGSVALAGPAPGLDEYARRLAQSSLDPGRGVAAAGLELPLDYGSLRLETGVIVPVRLPEDDRNVEWVFVGRARLRVEAPDDVEAQQLASFTGGTSVDAPVERAILIVGDSALATRLGERSPVEVDPVSSASAVALLREWITEAERDGFGAREALLRAMAGDPAGIGFFGVWFESSRLGRGYYRIDPSQPEPVSLGAYQLLDRRDLLTRRAKKRAERVEKWKAKKERPQQGDPSASVDDEDTCGTGVGDEREQDLEDSLEETREWIEPWISAVRQGAAPESARADVEPEHYTVELDLAGDDLFAKGTARIRLRAQRDGTRVVRLDLGRALEACEALDGQGRPLAFHRMEGELLVLLDEPTVAGKTFELAIRFAGSPIDHWYGRYTLRHTRGWHPHAGNLDRATYDVTLRWPEEKTLLAAGRRVDGGSVDGVRWEHRVFDIPVAGFTFEVGDLDTIDEHIGHIDLTFGFHRQDSEMTEEVRTDVRQAVKASILFFETQFGLLPIERMTVVTADRGFSQGMLGFVTLAEGAMHGILPALQDNRSSQELRLETIAHEVSHQWWGNLVGWDSYRDQWLSEALADFSATRFMEQIAPQAEDYRRRHATLWRKGLNESTRDGRTVGSLGPVVLGSRLYQNHGPAAYQSIVYEKGAAVFSTLAQRLGPEPTWRMLGALARAVNNRVISTSTFVKALERMSGQDLQGFVGQYIRGTGMPAMFYDYSYHGNDQDGWHVEGRVLQLPAPQSRYVVRRSGSGWDVARQRLGAATVADWANVVPFRVTMGSGDPEGAAQTVQGTLEIEGERSTFSVRVEHRPTDFQLDPLGQILADVEPERFEPKDYLCRIGEQLARIGRFDEGLEILDRALRSETVFREADIPDHLEQLTRELDARIRLGRARILLDRGDPAAARDELDAAEKLLPADSSYYAGERAALEARLALIRGKHVLALETLNDYLEEHGVMLQTYRQDSLLDDSALSSIKISRGEMLALLAVASHESGEADADLLVRLAGLAGVDMRALLEGEPPS